MPTYAIGEFSGGRDKRPRVYYGREKNRFKNLDNAYIGKDRKVHRRWPLRFAPGTINQVPGAIPSFGAISVGGVVTYFAPKTASLTVVIPLVSTNVLQFDELPGHMADSIVDAKLFNGTVVALIRHHYLGATTAYTYKLHVFDGLANKPTYVEDPYCPTSWGPTLPLHVYRTGALGAQVSYVPRMGIAAGKIYLSGPDNNLYFCSPSNARVWNTRTPVQLQNQGEWYYWHNYDTYAAGTVLVTTNTWVVSEDPLNLSKENGWTCYVLEYCDTTGTWQKLIEDSITGPAPTAQGHYQVISVANPYVGATTNLIGFKIVVPANTTPIYRFRLIAGSPPITVVSGCVWSDNQNRSGGVATFEDVAYPVRIATAIPPTPPYARLLLVAPSFGFVPTFGQYLDVNSAGITVAAAANSRTGYDRYHSLILGWDLNSTATAVSLTSYVAYQTQTIGYGWQTGNASQFFLDRTAKETGLAGNGVAGFLPTATRARSDGGPITAISVIKDYLGVHYRSLTLLYAVNPNQLLDAIRDTTTMGTGPYSDGVVVQFHHQTIMFSERGFRAFSVGGYLSDRADDTNIGEANEIFDPAATQLVSAVFWPYTGQYVAVVQISGVNWLYVFDYSRESKISAWSRWQIGASPAVKGPCGMSVVGPRLYIILASGGIAYLDAAATDGQFFDDIDLAGNRVSYAYQSVVECYQNDLNRISTDKLIDSVDLVIRGKTTVSFNVMSLGTERNIPGTVVSGITRGDKKILLRMRGFSIAPKFVSTDSVEWILDSYSLSFTEIKR